MSLILDTLPTTEEFFHIFWNKKPFVVRNLIPADTLDALIDEDHLAGLSMEEEIESRLVRKGAKQSEWTCDYGPFDEEDFADLGETDWSLLVQNTDQYHTKTAELLKHFNFSPRWLLDDIMVSFSPKGGTVGAHTDSYHVFLVQGKGQRRWKVASEPIKIEDMIEGIPLKILKEPFEGEVVTVNKGDIIYIPPKFAHQGVSLEPSLTYSVGFLGPSLSEMLTEFGQYLEENHHDIPRYLGQNLTESAVPFQVTSEHIGELKNFMTGVFDQDYFNKWLIHYFSRPIQSDEDDQESDVEITDDAVADLIAENTMLIKPPSVKMMLAPLNTTQKYSVSIGGLSFELDFADLNLVDAMVQESSFTAATFSNHTEVLKALLENGFLESIIEYESNA